MNRFEVDSLRTNGHLTTTTLIGQDLLHTLPARHVVFGVDESYLAHASINLMSIVRNDPTVLFHFHIITSSCLDPFSAAFREIAAAHRFILSIHRLSHELFERAVQSKRFPQSIYYRLLAPSILREHDQALYLDADMVCLQSLVPLWDQLAHGEVVAVVRDCAVGGPQRAAALGMAGTDYFNSGMMLINLKAWRQLVVSERALTVIESQPTQMLYPDQDALNIVLEGKVRFVDGRFNFLVKLEHSERDYARQIPHDTVLLHYAGNNKPWQAWNGQPAVAFYRQVRADSPWRDHALDGPGNLRQARLMYRHHLRRREFVQGFIWRFRRALWRLMPFRRQF